MSQPGREDANDASQEDGQAIRKVSVILPYSLSNVVFIQTLPFWMCFGLSVICLVLGAISLLTGREGGEEQLAIGAVGLPVSLALLSVGWWFLWRKAVCGYKAAVIILYILYIPVVLAGLFYVIATAFQAFGALWALVQGYPMLPWIVGGIFSLAIGVMLLSNLYETGLWDFVNLNNRCPSCREWRFGYIKRPTTVKCPGCNVLIEFVRAE